jgi:DNA-binding HxlR family transcriptional regulator
LKNEYDCPIEFAIDKIGGRWKPWILWILIPGTKRFGEIRREITEINVRMLTKQLRELEADGLIDRKVYAEIPPKVEYSLSEAGKSLIPILSQLHEWGDTHSGEEVNFKSDSQKRTSPSKRVGKTSKM